VAEDVAMPGEVVEHMKVLTAPMNCESFARR
jgi:hypothetical protein